MHRVHKKLILASSSPARQMLLSRLRIPFTTLSPDIDESQLPDENVNDMLIRLAIAKAKACADSHPDSLIIGSDTIGTLDNSILCKPLTFENAVTQLKQVSGKKVRFMTSLCLLDTATNQHQTSIDTYDVYFRELSDETIHHYIRTESPLQCAGCFQAEGLGIALIERFDGNDYTALIGLPLIQLVTMLNTAGMPIV